MYQRPVACHQSWHQDSQHVDPDTAQIALSNPAVCLDLVRITSVTFAFTILIFVLVQLYFPNIYDIKYLMKFCGNLHGGLNKLAESLDVKRLGPQHQVIPFAPTGASSASCFALGGPDVELQLCQRANFHLAPLLLSSVSQERLRFYCPLNSLNQAGALVEQHIISRTVLLLTSKGIVHAVQEHSLSQINLLFGQL